MMSSWYIRFQHCFYQSRYFSVLGNALVLLVCLREIWWVGNIIFASSEFFHDDMIPIIVWDCSALIVVTLIALFRVVALIRMQAIRFISILLSGILMSATLLIYWANSVNFWTCYISDPNALICHIYVSGRPDLLAGIGMLYVIVGLTKNIAIGIAALFTDLDERDLNS